MRFITDRFPKQGIRTPAGRNFDFDLDYHAASHSVYFCRRDANGVYPEVGSTAFLKERKASNLKNKVASRRLGHTGPEDMDLTPRNVYRVDCDDVNTLYDKPKGHSYFRSGTQKGSPGLVFQHIFSSLLPGRVFPDDADRRATIIKNL